MELSTRKRNIAFWVLQLLGWGFINSIGALIPQNISFEMIVFSIIVGTFIGVFATSILRLYLKRNVHFDSFGGKEVIKILVSTLLAAALFGLLNVFFGYIYVEFRPELTETEMRMFEGYDKIMVQVLNSIFLVGAWVITYLVIKLLLKLNQNRIERLELNTTLKQAQLNTLKGQINPHFMFNSLNNIRGLMLEDVEKSRDMLTKLSEMLRYSLTKNNVNAIALEEELEMVDNYIALSKIQFEDRLVFIKEVGSETLAFQIPPMIIQLLVENAVKHGISNSKFGGTIKLITEKTENSLCIRVINTGKLIISENSTHLGLKNIKQRLRLLYGKGASFLLEELNEEVVATINIPLP